MTSHHVLQILLWLAVQNQVCIRQRVIVDEVVKFGLLCHGNIQRILDPSAVNGDHSPIPEQQLHAAGVHVEFAGSFIVLHTRVLSALRHLYSCDFCDTSFLIRFWTHSRLERAGIIISEENKKSEPFSYREKVRIFMVWCRYNMDTNRIEARFTDGTTLAIDCIVVEDEYCNTPAQRAELDWLLYNKPMEYAQLVLGGEIEHYLSLGCDHGRMED